MGALIYIDFLYLVPQCINQRASNNRDRQIKRKKRIEKIMSKARVSEEFRLMMDVAVIKRV